jgi:hypothetical protein
VIDAAAALDRTVALFQADLFPGADAATIVRALTSTRVTVTADTASLGSPTGRAALVGTVSTVARLGAAVSIVLPVTVANDRIPPLIAARVTLKSALDELLNSLITPPSAGEADVVISLSVPVDEDTICIGGDGFTARLAIGESAGGWSGREPYGAGLAAAAAGAEVARHAMRHLASVVAIAPHYRDKLLPRPTVLSLPAFDTPSGGVDLGALDIVSAGAVTHAVLFTLMRVADLAAYIRVIDDDIGEIHHLNRYELLKVQGLDVPKTILLESFSTPQLHIRGIQTRFTDASDLRDSLAPRVLVGADNVQARQDAQSYAPGWLGVGATGHLEIAVSEHEPGGPCAACKHATAEHHRHQRFPTISFVSSLSGTLLAYLTVRDAVSPPTRREQISVLDALNLAGATLHIEPVQPNPLCPLRCIASARRLGAIAHHSA